MTILHSTATPDAAATVEHFTRAFRNHAGGVAAITADAGSGPVGCTATSVASVSVDPPMLMFSISDQSSSAPTILACETVVVHLLGADQFDIAKLCSTSGIDRFADTSIWSRLDTGEPYFPAARSWIRGRIVTRTRAGTSTVLVIEALAAITRDADDRPLVYHNRAWHALSEHSKLEG